MTVTSEIIALLLAAFVIINAITFYLYAKSHKRVQFRQPALSKSLLSSMAILGGATAAFFAITGLRMVRAKVMPARIAGILAIVQVLIVSILVANNLANR